MSEPTRPTLLVLTGLPAAGKTTRAKQLEETFGALRLTPDEWMIPLFAHSDADGKRDVLEGRLVWVAQRALRLGVSVILDFGLWGKDERSALRWLAGEAGADCVLVYLPVDADEQARRVTARFAAAPESTFAIPAAYLARYRSGFQAPDAEELSGDRVDEPPAGYDSWRSWVAARWPTSI